MNCSPELVGAYVDGELETAQLPAVEEHVAGCGACGDLYRKLREQREQIREAAPYYRATADLRALVRRDLRRAARPPREIRWRGLATAACVLLAVSGGWNVVQWQRRAGETLTQSVVEDHIRSVIGTHLFDVPSSDRHTVKPWFAGQLDFAPEVKDLAAEGFPLAGGRVDYLAGRRVAALVYRRRQHIINLFTWPGETAEGRASHQGFHILRWSEKGMNYWAVSDVAATDLQEMRRAWENAK